MTIRSTPESGFTMLELLCVVGISAVAILSMVKIGSTIQLHNQTANADRVLMRLVSEATSFSKVKGSFAALNCGDLQSPCYFVDQKIVSEGQKNPFGGKINVMNLADEQIKISFQNIPREACTSLILSMNQTPGLRRVELMNPLQTSATGSSTDPDCTGAAPIPPRVIGAGAGNGNLATAASPRSATCQGGGGSYNVTSVDMFPIPVRDAATLCGAEPSYTLAWTIEKSI